jgi:hypothetical protein
MRMDPLDDNIPGTAVRPTFFPPLVLQRRAFLLELAKAEGVRSVRLHKPSA